MKAMKASRKPRKRLSLKRPAALKRQRGKGEAFGIVASLGSICLAAKQLEAQGLRQFKLPFDWIFSSAYMVRHALRDNFKSFLDKKLYSKATDKETEGEDEKTRSFKGTTHRLYLQMTSSSRRNVVFPHHRMWAGSPSRQEDHASFVRSVERFNKVLHQREHRTLFVMTCLVRTNEALEAVRNTTWGGPPGRGACPVPDEGGPELCCVAEVKRLFEELKGRAGGFHLDVLYIVLSSVSEAAREPTSSLLFKQGAQSEKPSSRQTLAIHELHCKGENTGLKFKNKLDTLLFNRILFKGREFCTVSLDDSRAKGYTDNPATAASSSSTAAPKPNKLRLFSEGSLDRAIRIQQENPKKADSIAWQRYEKYKKAKTVKQFLKLGARTGDLKYDMAHGYIAFA